MSNLKGLTGLITGDGQSSEHQIAAGPCNIFLDGDFDGATVALETTVGDSGFVPTLDGTNPITFIESTGSAYNFFSGQFIRFSTTGAGGSTLINYQINMG